MRGSGPCRERKGAEGIMQLRSQARAGGQSAMLRFLVGVFWIILIGFIILVILNIPGIR